MRVTLLAAGIGFLVLVPTGTAVLMILFSDEVAFVPVWFWLVIGLGVALDAPALAVALAPPRQPHPRLGILRERGSGARHSQCGLGLSCAVLGVTNILVKSFFFYRASCATRGSRRPAFGGAARRLLAVGNPRDSDRTEYLNGCLAVRPVPPAKFLGIGPWSQKRHPIGHLPAMTGAPTASQPESPVSSPSSPRQLRRHSFPACRNRAGRRLSHTMQKALGLLWRSLR